MPDDRGLPPGSRQQIYAGEAGEFLAKVDPYYLRRSRLHMYGGTTSHFGFWARPLDEVDFLPRPGYRESSWPISRDELIPYYHEAMTFGHYGPFTFDDLPFWERALSGVCFPGQLGDPLRGAIFHAQYEERFHDFQLQLGDELRPAENVTVLFNASLLRLETSEDRSRVRSLLCASIENGRKGRRFRVTAQRVVLAMGGIETVRMRELSDKLGNTKRD